MIPIADAVICWSPSYAPEPPSTLVRVVRNGGRGDEAIEHETGLPVNTYGAGNSEWRDATDAQRLQLMEGLLVTLTTQHGIDPEACRRAFETVLEWRKSYPCEDKR